MATSNVDKAKILILSTLQKGRGNYTTVKRISEYYEAAGVGTMLCDPAHFNTVQDFFGLLQKENVSFILAIHAGLCGKLLRECRVTYVVIFGGTDINVYYKLPAMLALMTDVVNNARHLIAFSKEMVNKATEIWPDILYDKFSIIPQGVEVTPSNFSLQECLHHHLGATCKEYHAFTVAGGIRPVKDSLYLIKAFSDWQQATNLKVNLVFIGSIVDEEYGHTFLQMLKKHGSSVVYIGYLGAEDTHAAIKQSFALVNSSNSEGMPASVMEAQCLGVPVLARDIAGNRSLVQDGHTGLLFDSPQAFVEKAEILLGDSKLRETLTRNALQFTQQHHSCNQERKSYLELYHGINHPSQNN